MLDALRQHFTGVGFRHFGQASRCPVFHAPHEAVTHDTICHGSSQDAMQAVERHAIADGVVEVFDNGLVA